MMKGKEIVESKLLISKARALRLTRRSGTLRRAGAMINAAKEQMYVLTLKALAAKNKINLLPEVTVTGSKSQNSTQNSNKSLEERMQDMFWQFVKPNSYGNNGRYNQPGRTCDDYYSNEFLKWYYDK